MIMKPNESSVDAEHDAIMREHVYRTVHGLEVQFALPGRSAQSGTTPTADDGKNRLIEHFDAEHGVIDSVDEASAESFPADDPLTVSRRS